MGNSRIKVVGYAKKEFFGNGIEYRAFNPDLLSGQLGNTTGTTLFTMGNFSITTNMEPKNDKTFITSKFSKFVTLSDLRVTPTQAQTILNNNTKVKLNLDKTNLNYYALFGSLTEYIRVSLEEIITNWPASLYTNSNMSDANGNAISGYTYEDYNYDLLTNASTFKVNTTFIQNNFEINYLANGTILNSFNENNPLRDLSSEYLSYVISSNNIETKILDFTGSTNKTNDYIYFKVDGDVFSGGSITGTTNYHIKPNQEQIEHFFNALPDFQSYLLNRHITPIYTASFRYPITTNNGLVLYITESVTWPVSDGYNIDFQSSQYFRFVTKLVDIGNKNDLKSSDLMNRFLVSESISNFDTTPVHLSELDQDTSGQKVNKTLRIYGREFDEINKLITGIEFAHTVSYDKQDNTPDVYLKDLARVLGWELISSVVENDLLSNYLKRGASTFSGQSVGLTSAEADIELWRRLILNSPWIWKSKGARKSIEFLLRFIGAPKGLVKFNEHIYKAKAPIDLNLFKEILQLNGLSTDLSTYPIDSDGYPRPFADTSEMYFQNYGLWYRQTGGGLSDVDILTGNNPHLGPYDGGYKYINQFNNLIPNFTAVTITSSTITNGTTNLFTNNQNGTYDETAIDTNVDTIEVSGLLGEDISDCVVFRPIVISDPYSGGTINNGCGCPCEGTDNVISLCLTKKDPPLPSICDSSLATSPTTTNDDGLYNFSFYQYNKDGSIFNNNGSPILRTSIYASKECCTKFNGTPFPHIEVVGGVTVNSGYACCSSNGKCGCTISCQWLIVRTPKDGLLDFVRPDGSHVIVTPDGCHCPKDYTIKVPNVTDPYTNEVGIGCKLTDKGLKDLKNPYSTLIRMFEARKNGKLPCYGFDEFRFV
jgi:hypothetical protein